MEIQEEGGSTRRAWFQYDEHRFLLDDFLARFEFEPDHQKIRNSEVLSVQSRISDLQTELVQGQSNPALIAALVQEREAAKSAKVGDEETEDKSQHSLDIEPRHVPVPLPPAVGAAEVVDMATGTVAQAIEGGLTPERMAALRAAANRQHEIATERAQWIEGKTQEIASAIKQFTPFYSEQAAAALAQTEDVRAFVSDLLMGIESLDLYLGKDVEVQAVREGKGLGVVRPPVYVAFYLAFWQCLGVAASLLSREKSLLTRKPSGRRRTATCSIASPWSARFGRGDQGLHEEAAAPATDLSLSHGI